MSVSRLSRFFRVTSPSSPAPPSGESLITIVTVTENGTGGAKTNEIAEFGFPIAPNVFSAGERVKFYDDDGSGGKGTVLSNFQWDMEVTPTAGGVRFGLLTGILPSLGSSATRKVHIYKSSDAHPTGTAIALSDISALGGYSDGLFKVSAIISGTTYTASIKDIIDASTTTYTKTALWRSSDTICSGPLMTRWRMRMPVRNGGTAHASGDGLHIEFILSAYKAGTGAVSGGNPITFVQCDVVLHNADAARASPADLYYDLKIERATSLSDPTLISTNYTDRLLGVQNFVRASSSPAATITLSSLSAGTGRTFTLSAGSWDSDILGKHIVDTGGSGRAIVTARTSSTVVTAWIYQPFSATSYTSGNWKVEGVGHWYNAERRLRAGIGTAPTNVALWGDQGTGTAITPNTKAAMDYAITSEMLPEYAATFAEINHSSGGDNGISILNRHRSSDGSTSLPPFGTLGDAGGTTQPTGEYRGWMPGTGGRNDIALHAGWTVEGLIKPDTEGRRRIFENAEHYGMIMHCAALPPLLSGTPSGGALPMHPRADNGVPYAWDAGKGTQMARPSASQQPYQHVVPDGGHQPSAPYIAYLMTGDYTYLRQIQAWAGGLEWSAYLKTTAPTPQQCNPYGDDNSSYLGLFPMGQTRAGAWAYRDRLLSAAVTPNTDKPSLWHSRASEVARLTQCASRAVSALNGAGATKYTVPSTAPVYINQNYHFATQTPGTSGMELSPPWQESLMITSWAFAKYVGEQDANALAFLTWLMRTKTEAYGDSGIVDDLFHTTFFYITTGNLFSPTDPDSWGELWRRTCLWGPNNINGWGQQRQPTGTLTLSATSGTGVTATFSNAYFAGGGTGTNAWYVDGIIRDSSDGACAIITNVVSSTQVVCDIATTFSSTTPTIGNIKIPGAHPTDYTGDRYTLFGASDDAHQVAVNACNIARKSGIDSSAFITWMTGRPSYGTAALRHHFIART